MSGTKHDSGKPRLDLIPPHMEAEVGRVLAFGAEKYGAENWRQLDNLRSRYIAAAKRHINEIQRGSMLDAESGLSHAAHAVCCLMFLGEDEILRETVEWATPEQEARQDVVGQNGNDGLHYAEVAKRS